MPAIMNQVTDKQSARPCLGGGAFGAEASNAHTFSSFRDEALAIRPSERNYRKFRCLVSRVARSPHGIFKFDRPSLGGTVGLIAERVPGDERVPVWTLAIVNVFYDWFGPRSRFLQLVVLAVIGDGYILGPKFLDEFRALYHFLVSDAEFLVIGESE